MALAAKTHTTETAGHRPVYSTYWGANEEMGKRHAGEWEDKRRGRGGGQAGSGRV